VTPPVLRLGIAGLGLASTFTLPAFAKHARVRLAAAADLRRPARERFAAEFGAKTFETIETLCASPDVDAVYIATPNDLHAEHAIVAAEHRKHVIVEKPMALTIGACEAMNAAAQRNGIYLLCGHTHSFAPPIRRMREIINSGELGRLTMLHTWNYTDLLYRPRMAWELDTRRGGGVVFVQAPHQVDIVRLLSGGLVRSVRAMTGAWATERPTEGNYAAYLEFEDGTPATLVYSGYAHFDTAELHEWVGERGQARDPETHARGRAAFQALGMGDATELETRLRESKRYGGESPRTAGGPAAHQVFGLTLASCERGDLRQAPGGLYVYGDDGRQEIPVPLEPSGATAVIDELYEAIRTDTPPPHDGRWGEATVEVCLAILESARLRREIFLSHQVPWRG